MTMQETVLELFNMQVTIRTVLGILEVFRRFIWNLFRVEVENMKYENDFYSIEGFHLPFDLEIKKENEET